VLLNQLKESFMAYQNKTELLWIQRFLMMLIIIVMLSTLVMSIYSGKQFYQESALIQNKVVQHYQIPKESAGGLQCFKGMLHYPNQGNFSGLLSFSPAIGCDAEEFDSLQQNPYQTEFYISAFLFLFSTGLGWLYRKLH
jgi:hypothetical protein